MDENEIAAVVVDAAYPIHKKLSALTSSSTIKSFWN